MFLTRTISTASKLGYVYATYSPVALTCSDSCPLKAGGCFAREGRVGMVQRRIQRELGASAPTAAWGDVCAELEASEIRDAIARGRDLAPLRIHVSGDADTDWRAQRLASAAHGWRHPVWTYTHSWRHVERASWGRVSALASVETLADAVAALDRGFAPAIVVEAHPEDGRAKVDPETGVRVIPCPQQTRGVQCDQCGLCWRDGSLAASRSAIAFAVHGSGAKKASAAVKRANQRLAMRAGIRSQADDLSAA